MVSSILQHRRKAFRSVGSLFIFEEGFETPTTGYENSWTGAGTGTVDPANTGTVIVGSQSLRINLSAQTGSTYTTFAGQGSLFTKFRLRVASTNGGNQVIATIRDGTTIVGTLTLAGASRVIRATAAGGANATASGTGSEIPLDTPIYVWFEYVKGTGSNAICRAGWASTDSKPALTSTTTNTAISTGSATTDATRLYLGNTGSGTFEAFYDRVQAAPAAF